ncbi:hypothetical protein [Streptomyces showdoensis]|uniref:hypothetical protein n=1 Tax=Streptomyces showdoensis TaxID=68268 RepID=UPI0031E5792E
MFDLPEGVLVLTRPDDPDETVLTSHGRPLSPDDRLRIVGADGEDVGRYGTPDTRGRGCSRQRPSPSARRLMRSHGRQG